MRRLSIILICFTLSSCQLFDTEKISSETFYEEELKTINWAEVDKYPAFAVCGEFSEKEDQKSCFVNTLTERLYKSFQLKEIVASQDLNHTVHLYFAISKEGNVAINHIKMDSVVKVEIPFLEKWIRQGIDSLPQITPAYKRGIPVNTEFILPIKVETNSL